METQNRMKHIANFSKYSPSLEEHFNKPVKSGRKPNESKRRRKRDADIVIDRMEKTKKVQRIEDPNAERPIVYELFFRSMVPRLLQRCQGNCGVKLCTADEGDCLLVKSYGTSTFSVKDETRSKCGPLCILFENECLKEYAHQKHDVFYKEFPLSLVTINEAALKKLSDYEKSQLEEFGITI